MLSHFSHVLLFMTLWTVADQILRPWDPPSKNTKMGFHCLLQGILPTHGLNFVSYVSCIGRHVLYYTWEAQSLNKIPSFSCVWLFATPWTAACQASLCITNSWSLLTLTSVRLVMPCKHLILCRPLLLLPSIFPRIRVFPNESILCIRWPKIGVSASASVLPMNIQDWFPLEWTGLIALQPRGLSRVFSSISVQKHQFFNTQLSL